MLYIQRTSLLPMNLFLSALFAFIPLDVSSAITVEELQGLNISVRVSYDMRVQRAEGVFSGPSTLLMKFTIDENGWVAGDVTRTVQTPRGPLSRSNRMNAPISKPGTPPGGGDAIWLIDGDKLVLLRTFEAGGFKTEIEFTGSGAAMKCTVHAPFVREEGAGNIRMSQSVKGGPVTILSAIQKSGDCKVTR